MLKFYGRENEIALLQRYQKLSETKSSQMVVVTGRRRIGKTRLINEALNSSSSQTPFLYFFVNGDKTEKGNIEAFVQLHAAPLGLTDLPVQFSDIRSLFEYILKRSQTQPLTFFIDEFQNLETVAPSFFSDLQALWDRYAGKSHLMLVTAGSVASTMREITENPKAPLYGRPSAFIRLQPLPLKILHQILEEYSGGTATADDHLALWMMTGGVAKYVELFMDSGCVTKESMIELATSSSSFFLMEGENLLKTAFKRDYGTYFAIMQKVAEGITERAKLATLFEKDIDISGHLKKLEEHYALLTKEMPFASQLKKGRNYRLVMNDTFLQFWFRYLFTNKSLLEMSHEGSKLLTQAILKDFPEYTGRSVLEQYFRRELMETGTVSECAPWWNRKGGDEIDIIAYQPFDKRLLFIEVKRESRKISFQKLKEKSFAFLAANPSYANCEIVYEGRSLENIKVS